jgi:hypothetical protein
VRSNDRFRYDDDDYPGRRSISRPTRTAAHSPIGIASFLLSLGVGVCFFLTFALAGALEAMTPGGIPEDSPLAILVGLIVIACIAGLFLGIGLGIAGVVQSTRNRIFAFLGLAFNGCLILGICLLALIGILAD